eukprot:scaffold118707_cov63-Phaeocystis_antarctica.AAC.5
MACGEARRGARQGCREARVRQQQPPRLLFLRWGLRASPHRPGMSCPRLVLAVPGRSCRA